MRNPLSLVLADFITPKPSFSEAKAEGVRIELTDGFKAVAG